VAVQVAHALKDTLTALVSCFDSDRAINISPLAVLAHLEQRGAL
jgi:hypothetical protein